MKVFIHPLKYKATVCCMTLRDCGCWRLAAIFPLPVGFFEEKLSMALETAPLDISSWLGTALTAVHSSDHCQENWYLTLDMLWLFFLIFEQWWCCYQRVRRGSNNIWPVNILCDLHSLTAVWPQNFDWSCSSARLGPSSGASYWNRGKSSDDLCVGAQNMGTV